ncbi:MAG: metal-dependent transcriptional regulator [Clostridia bacterium]|nr:metal-dependent transcriptional regulator [Clostridia bacterium]
MPLNESGEMYLESIYVLCQKSGAVRSIDVAEFMNFSKPSVSRAVGLLKEKGYITVDKDGTISLTAEGSTLAKNIFERHTIITKVLTAMGVEETIAADDACRIEHVISPESFEAMKVFLEKNK